MGPDAQRRLESALDDDSYTCERCCSDLPYTLWNTCPLCLCGLMPVLVVCFSAIFRLDYATHVTDIGAKIINEMGLSYTVYYTAGCWPTMPNKALVPTVQHDEEHGDHNMGVRRQRCNDEQFEVAAGEFDALSGSLLKVRNVTKLHMRRVDAVKVSPDWRYIVFVALRAQDVGSLYAVGAEETDAQEAVHLLHVKQEEALDAQCQLHSEGVLKAAGLSSGPVARLNGFKHLQVIIPGVDPSTHTADMPKADRQVHSSSSPLYRAAFAFECAEPTGPSDLPLRGPGVGPLRFSKLAVLDFRLMGLNATRRGGPPGPNAHAQSELRILDAVPTAPDGSEPEVREAISRFKSQSCPRFVPSKQGAELLFVAEDLVPANQVTTAAPSVWLPPSQLPSRRLGVLDVPSVRQAAAAPRALAEEKEESVIETRPPMACCDAMTAECLACKQGVSPEQFCIMPEHAHIDGCGKKGPVRQGSPGEDCCQDPTADCLACMEGRSKDDFCLEAKNENVDGCRATVTSTTKKLASPSSTPSQTAPPSTTTLQTLEAQLVTLADTTTTKPSTTTEPSTSTLPARSKPSTSTLPQTSTPPSTSTKPVTSTSASLRSKAVEVIHEPLEESQTPPPNSPTVPPRPPSTSAATVPPTSRPRTAVSPTTALPVETEESRGCCQANEATCLACLAGQTVWEYCQESGKHAGVRGCEQTAEDLQRLHLPRGSSFSFVALKAEAMLLNVGLGALPFAPVEGCPEFVPTLYYNSKGLAETVRDRLFHQDDKKEAEEAALAERKFRDTFVILSDPTSASVLGVDAQVLAVSLPEGPSTGAVSRVHLLYNVGNAPNGPGSPTAKERLRLGGCGPIRAAGRQGHMRLQSVVETLMATLRLHTEKSGYTAWLACLTADQRIAIVESPKREHWINMSMPYPIWTGKPTQAIWCPEEREEACFEVWSNPNPNE